MAAFCGTFAPDDAVPLAEARFAAVERLAQLATDEKADALLVSGDVFDAQTVSARTIRCLFNVMSGYAGPWPSQRRFGIHHPVVFEELLLPHTPVGILSLWVAFDMTGLPSRCF